jgi:hypothetical protein
MSNKELLNVINSYQNYINDFINVTEEDLNKIQEKL